MKLNNLIHVYADCRRLFINIHKIYESIASECLVWYLNYYIFHAQTKCGVTLYSGVTLYKLYKVTPILLVFCKNKFKKNRNLFVKCYKYN